MVFATFNFLETFLGFIFYFVPYWDYIRVAFFVWLLQAGGSAKIYEDFLAPLIRQHQDLINDMIEKTKVVGNEAAK